MPSIECGAAIRYPNFERGTAGCLMRFSDTPNRVLLMTAGHVVLPNYAKQNDPIYALDMPGSVLGTLRTWTSFQDNPTADAAFIWVDPKLITPSITALGRPAGLNTASNVGDTLRIVPSTGQTAARETKIEAVDSVDVWMPAWNETIHYQGQLLCRPQVTVSGDSGAVALDSQNRVVGMVVAGWSASNASIVTPISAILNNSAWSGAQLELVSEMPNTAEPPLLAGSSYRSLVANGFFSADPNDHSVPRSIRTNNPGALNYTAWQARRPGYAGKTESDGSTDKNVTTIYWTPEHGIGSWFYLLNDLYGYGTSGLFTLGQLAQRYSGQISGPRVEAYVTGWAHASNGALTADTAIDPSVDEQVLRLARAMFAHEAGGPTPLHDDQILFGIRAERDGTLPA